MQGLIMSLLEETRALREETKALKDVLEARVEMEKDAREVSRICF
jgi:regulator of replication initiation timing